MSIKIPNFILFYNCTPNFLFRQNYAIVMIFLQLYLPSVFPLKTNGENYFNIINLRINKIKP